MLLKRRTKDDYHKSEISANELSLAQAGIRACVGHL